MKRWLLVFMLVMITGCATAPEIEYVDRPVRVEIPIIVPPPEPPEIKEPFLPIWLLAPENIEDPDKIAKFYVKSIKILLINQMQLQCALDAYRTETEPRCPVIVEEVEVIEEE